MIRSISSFSGIVSNITGYTFSEIFDMKNPKFFVQLDGSIRNIPNALGVIDSTVSSKDHILYKLYSNYVSGKTSTVFFSYRFSRKGVQEDYWNPNMDNAQLDDYRTKFPFGEFERYFLNMWNAGGLKVFTEENFLETNIIGADSYLLNHDTIAEVLNERKKSLDVIIDLQEKKRHDDPSIDVSIKRLSEKSSSLEQRLQKVDSLYSLKDNYGRPLICTAKSLCAVGDIFKTDFSIHVGLDFADPFAKKLRARSIIFCVAKGLPNSRDNIFSTSMDAMTPRYIYFLLALHATTEEDKSTDKIKDFLEELDSEYDGLDTVCSERYGSWDMVQWCEERGILFEPVHPNYDRQREAFNEFYNVVEQGRFKTPQIVVSGTKENNILREEMMMFDHDSHTKWFGSPEKMEAKGVQDDSIFAAIWCLFGGRFTTSDKFRMRNAAARDFGTFVQTEKHIAKY